MPARHPPGIALSGLLAALAACAAPPPARTPFGPAAAAAHQAAWARYLGVPVRVISATGMQLVLVPPGRFAMGSPTDEEWHRPDEVLHEVTLSRAFYLGATEVTQAQWTAVMGDNPSFFEGDALPVDTVSYGDAAEFCARLSAREGVRYRLPTEAEWEYACRAGTTTPFHTGATIRPDQANYDGNRTYAGGPQGVFRETTTAAGTFPPNAWGLHDMHGNVWEWCADWYGPYPPGAALDPQGPPTGEARITRGGTWINFPAVCRSANRGQTIPDRWNFHFGLRVVRELR